VAQKLINSHLVEGEMKAGTEIGLKIDQTLTQDATGTMVMLEFEAMDLPRVQTELSAQYIDYNLIQADFRNLDDHLFLRSACQKFGLWYSRPGSGVSHPLHMERFGVPGKTLVGSDSHTPAAGSLGREIYQAYIGSAANPGLRDFAVAALGANGRQAHDRVSFDINPTSRQILENLAEMGPLSHLIRAGARIHQAGCNGCIGMRQAPATGQISLRTVPRNFIGRSSTKEDAVYLCSPETALWLRQKGVNGRIPLPGAGHTAPVGPGRPKNRIQPAHLEQRINQLI
jgi:homoaconitase/3-isopropylmalate dehydratase large subunit